MQKYESILSKNPEKFVKKYIDKNLKMDLNRIMGVLEDYNQQKYDIVFICPNSMKTNFFIVETGEIKLSIQTKLQELMRSIQSQINKIIEIKLKELHTKNNAYCQSLVKDPGNEEELQQL